MPPKKYALKGQPDFHNLSDDKVKSFLDLTQQLIFAYKPYDSEKVKVLESIWKDLSVESTERVIVSSEKAGSEAKTHVVMIRKAPKLRKSPAKRKI